MILQALKEYYDRKIADPESGMAPEGFEKKALPFLIVIDNNGAFVSLEDTRERQGKKLIAKTFLVPRSMLRSGSRSFETTFLLWDHFGYLLRHPESEGKARKQHEAWLGALAALPEVLRQDAGVAAILEFYKLGGVEAVKASANWNDCMSLNSCNMTFRLAGDAVPVPCRPRIQDYVRQSLSSACDAEEMEQESHWYARCLITGECGEIARIHGKTPINKDSKSLVGFQRHSGYDSYGKEQGYNAPVSKTAEFAYTTGLNTLLKSSRSRMQVGDATTVFWAEKTCQLEQEWLDYFDPPRDDPDRGVRAVESLFAAVKSGAFSLQEGRNRFYVLGLAPSSMRIAIRFWVVDTVKDMSEKICQHFTDTRITHGPRDRDTLSLFRLLVSTAPLGKADNTPPNLAGDFMRAILEDRPYPQTLLQAAIRRIRAEQSKKDKATGKSLSNVPYERAALVKACVNRLTRHRNLTKERELTVSLDESNTNTGYRLGRLFAVLEKVQAEANPGINATIRDRFYGAASGTPVAVFANLMRLKNHHLAKLENTGRRIFFERLIGKIVDGINDFPAHLSLEDQGRFAIGYYHQVQDFYTKKSDKGE